MLVEIGIVVDINVWVVLLLPVTDFRLFGFTDQLARSRLADKPVPDVGSCVVNNAVYIVGVVAIELIDLVGTERDPL